MEQRRLSVHSETVTVDECPQCRGVFIDYFDGEPTAIAVELRETLEPVNTQLDTVSCTDCNVTMRLQAYLDSGPDLYRCSACMAAFLTPQQIEALAGFTLSEPEEPKRGWVSILKAWLD